MIQIKPALLARDGRVKEVGILGIDGKPTEAVLTEPLSFVKERVIPSFDIFLLN
jgi:hypothetical protein